jgi:hypothetical protein
MAQNKWVVTFLENPEGTGIVEGDDIAELKVGAKPFR